jgi:uncharacterized membrane protein
MDLKKMLNSNITVKPGESFEDATHRTIKEKNEHIERLHAENQFKGGLILILVIVIAMLLSTIFK